MGIDAGTILTWNFLPIKTQKSGGIDVEMGNFLSTIESFFSVFVYWSTLPRALVCVAAIGMGVGGMFYLKRELEDTLKIKKAESEKLVEVSESFFGSFDAPDSEIHAHVQSLKFLEGGRIELSFSLDPFDSYGYDPATSVLDEGSFDVYLVSRGEEAIIQSISEVTSEAVQKKSLLITIMTTEWDLAHPRSHDAVWKAVSTALSVLKGAVSIDVMLQFYIIDGASPDDSMFVRSSSGARLFDNRSYLNIPSDKLRRREWGDLEDAVLPEFDVNEHLRFVSEKSYRRNYTEKYIVYLVGERVESESLKRQFESTKIICLSAALRLKRCSDKIDTGRDGDTLEPLGSENAVGALFTRGLDGFSKGYLATFANDGVRKYTVRWDSAPNDDHSVQYYSVYAHYESFGRPRKIGLRIRRDSLDNLHLLRD